jgi:hypothetical protein
MNYDHVSTNLAQGDTQLIDAGQFQWLAHGVSVAQYVVSLKISPRNLALSHMQVKIAMISMI